MNRGTSGEDLKTLRVLERARGAWKDRRAGLRREAAGSSVREESALSEATHIWAKPVCFLGTNVERDHSEASMQKDLRLRCNG